MTIIKGGNATIGSVRIGEKKAVAHPAKVLAKPSGAPLHPKERASKNRSAFADTRPAPLRERKTKNRSAFVAGATASPIASQTLAQRAAHAIGQLKQPQVPGQDATPQQLMQYQRDTQRYNEYKNLATATINTFASLPNPLPNGAFSTPPFPGPDSTPQQLAQFQVDLQKYVAAVKNTAGGSAGTPSRANPLADEAVRAIGSLTEPAIPRPDATAQDVLKYQQDSQKYAAYKALASSAINTVGSLPNPLPNVATALPRFPGPDSTPQQLAQFQVDLQKFVGAVRSSPATATTPVGSTPPAQPPPPGADPVEQAIYAIGQLKEPQIPGPDATPQQLAQYEKDSKRYDRVLELMSSIIKKRDELQMSIIRKF